jgi:4,5-DOPA dioxygenase extradiol
MNMTAPALFISHGAPTFALEPGQLGSRLTGVGEHLGNVKALLVVSPHWQTEQTTVMTTAHPRTLHDFGGFAPELYRIEHPAIGYPVLAAEIGQSLAETGRHIGLDDERGLDHGTWVPLRYLDPKAHIPSFQVSLRSDLDPWSAVRLGRALGCWRREGVAIVGSGSLTHNLFEWRDGAGDDASYAVEFRDWVREAVLDRDVDRLMNYRRLAPHARRAHPTEEHFLPLLVALGATFDDETAQVLDGGMTYGILSMESYAWGLPPLDIAADVDEKKNGWSVRRIRRSTPGDRHDEGGVACRSAGPASGPAFKA